MTSNNESVQFFIRLVNEKHSDLVASANKLLRELAGDNLNSKKSCAANTIKAAQDLRAILSKNDIPDWLTHTIHTISNFTDGGWSAQDLMPNFVSVKTLLDAHRWQFNQVDDAAFDFDSIFDHYKKESRLPELFNDIIRLLEEIESSGEVDSLSMIRALGKVIATIKKCKDGSYFSLNSAWEFLQSFLKNYMWAELSKLPVLGTALEALGKTIEEADEEMFKIHKQVQEELERTVTAEVKALTNKSNFSFLTYNKNGHFPIHNEVRQLPNTRA